jgi:hypothetical protein
MLVFTVPKSFGNQNSGGPDHVFGLRDALCDADAKFKLRSKSKRVLRITLENECPELCPLPPAK